MDIVLFSFNPFHGRANRSHHLARQLARHHRVFFVDPPESVHRCQRRRTEVETVDDGLINIRLPGGLAGRRFWWIQRLAEGQWLRKLRGVLREQGFGRQGGTACLHMVPTWGRAKRMLNPDMTIYDAHDDWRSIPPNNPKLIDRLERIHAESADVILAASDKTADRFNELGRQAIPLPNGCDVQHFARAATRDPSPLVAELPGPRVIYMGGIESCFDTEGVAHCARSMPEASFVLIGPELVEQTKLHDLPNVVFLGEQPYDDLPALLAGAVAVWIPFRDSDHAMGRDCVKLYEYLASGLPVVSAPLPRAHQLASVVWVSDGTPEGLCRALRQAMGDKSQDHHVRQRVEAARHDWSVRADVLETILVSAFAGGNHGR
jgi:glycosyltransferase involved in cell wall biosynthesis